MEKEEARKHFLSKRKRLSDETFSALNSKLCDVFFRSIDLRTVKTLHTFLPIKKQKEVDTWLIIGRLEKEFPHIRVAIPRVNNESSAIESFLFEGEHQLSENMWGIPEPNSGIPIQSHEIDIVLTPLVVADLKGNRVGYGRGFYDRFLVETRARKVGLSLFPPIEQLTGIDPTDVPLDALITPEQSYSF